jgi:hypothetical protein
MTTESATVTDLPTGQRRAAQGQALAGTSDQSRRAREPVGPENVLTKGAVNIAEILGRARDVLLFLRNVEDSTGEMSQSPKMGLYWIGGMVLDAIEHAEELAAAERT